MFGCWAADATGAVQLELSARRSGVEHLTHINAACHKIDARSRNVGMPGIHDVPFLTNSSMMGIDFVPEHLIIVGGSYLGLEFAQIYRRFGSDVTIVEWDRG
jgi:hypothetical protein